LDRRYEAVVRERAIAVRIFELYEQTLYTLKTASEGHDRRRRAFLGEVLAYMEGRLLRNPRLRYLWDCEGGNICVYFELATRKRYEEQVLAGCGSDSDDPLGPFHATIPES